MNEQHDSSSLLASEVVFGLLGLLLAAGLLKANELQAFLEGIDLYAIARPGSAPVVVSIYIEEVIGIVLFVATYMVFLFLVGTGAYVGIRKMEGRKSHTIEPLSYAIIALTVVQAISLAICVAHVQHKYNEIYQLPPGTVVQWVHTAR